MLFLYIYHPWINILLPVTHMISYQYRKAFGLLILFLERLHDKEKVDSTPWSLLINSLENERYKIMSDKI